MVSKKFILLLGLLSLLVVAVAACGDDNDNGPYNGFYDYDLGELTLTVTGSSNPVENKTYEGQADFDDISNRILSHDFAPQTFDLNLNPSSHELNTYALGGTAGLDSFTAHLSLYPDGDYQNEREFSSQFSGGSGSMTITKSTDDEIVGSFEFTLIESDYDNPENDSLDTLQLKGQFRATPVIPL